MGTATFSWEATLILFLFLLPSLKVSNLNGKNLLNLNGKQILSFYSSSFSKGAYYSDINLSMPNDIISTKIYE